MEYNSIFHYFKNYHGIWGNNWLLLGETRYYPEPREVENRICKFLSRRAVAMQIVRSHGVSGALSGLYFFQNGLEQEPGRHLIYTRPGYMQFTEIG